MYMRRARGVHEGNMRLSMHWKTYFGTGTPEYSGVDGQPRRIRSEMEMAYSPRKILEISGEVQSNLGEVRVEVVP
jgi:hypothetical protein